MVYILQVYNWPFNVTYLELYVIFFLPYYLSRYRYRYWLTSNFRYWYRYRLTSNFRYQYRYRLTSKLRYRYRLKFWFRYISNWNLSRSWPALTGGKCRWEGCRYQKAPLLHWKNSSDLLSARRNGGTKPIHVQRYT